MMLAVVDVNLCVGHERCHARGPCPTKAIVQIDPGEMVVIDTALCNGCGDCVSECPEGAITIEER
jgi:heterodisulfide reductase subunit A-like polyferredoxin